MRNGGGVSVCVTVSDVEVCRQVLVLTDLVDGNGILEGEDRECWFRWRGAGSVNWCGNSAGAEECTVAITDLST